MTEEAGTRQQDVSPWEGLTAEERYTLARWNATTAPYPDHATLASLFLAQAERTPDAVAYEEGDRTLTYAELRTRAGQVARELRALGITQECVVGVCLPRSLDAMVALLGVLLAGGAFLPLDPQYPTERLQFMLGDSRAAALITTAALRARLGAEALAWLDITQVADAPLGDEDLHLEVRPDSLAYVIYTSGSTGLPKGVTGMHRAMVNRFHWMWTTYPFLPDERGCQKTVLSFADSIWEIFGPLLVGIPTVIFSDAEARDARRLVAALAAHRVTRLVAVPSLLAAMLEAEPELGEKLQALRWLVSSGETLPLELARRLRRALPACGILNLYGSTEVAADVTCFEVPRTAACDAIPIGRPIANTTTYIVDETLRPLPPGQEGELCIGGVSLSRGYLYRDDLTAQRFVADPFSDAPAARMFRTGDRARYLPDGQIECLGRLDQQVKIRGIRVELGEVEAALLKHPDVHQAVVVAWEDAAVGRYLAGYVVTSTGSKLTIAELQKFLCQQLPLGMVPATLTLLPKLPLLPNGKVARHELPVPLRGEPQRAVDQPRTPEESVVARLFARALHIAAIGRDTDFFALGGHSLLAAKVLTEIHGELGVDLALVDLFANPTPARLAQVIVQAEPAAALPPILPVPRSAPLPLSSYQYQVWLTAQLDPDNRLYNDPYTVRIAGALNSSALRASLVDLVARYEILRTTYLLVDGEPRQVIAAPPAVDELPLIEYDLRDLPQEEAESRSLAQAQLDLLRPFDLTRGPLWRAVLTHVRDDDHRLYLTLHHSIYDAVGLYAALLPELVAFYETHVRNTPPPPPPPLQYADFAVWQQQRAAAPALAEQLRYWKRSLAGLPVLQLPTDYPRPATGSFRGDRYSFALPAELHAGLLQLAQRAGATLHMALIAAFQTLLFRYTGQTDLATATVASGRFGNDLLTMPGFFANTLVLRTRLQGSLSFLEVLGRVRKVALEAYEHKEVPFQQVVAALRPERVIGQNPLFQTLLLLDPLPPALPSGWRVSRMELHNGSAMCELSLHLAAHADTLHGYLEYSTDLFARDTIGRLVTHLQTLVTGIIADPAQPVATLPLVPSDEATRIDSLLGQRATFPVSCTLAKWFCDTAGQKPDAVAVTYEGTQLTYQQLLARATQLAHELRALGVTPDTKVALFLERSLELVVAIVGTVLAGGAYVPLDPTAPGERVAFLLADSAPRVLITQPRLRERLPGFAGAVVGLDFAADVLPPAAAAPLPLPPCGLTPQHLAYVIYTSGSTGKPKGVEVTHGNVVRLFTATAQWFGFAARDVWTLFHSYAFDFSVWELWGALLYGGRQNLLRHFAGKVVHAGPRKIARLSVPNEAGTKRYRQVTTHVWNGH